MRRYWLLRGLRFVVLAAVFLAALGFVVMSLWNWLIPALFNGPVIGFGEAVGLLVLSKILFGRFGARFGGGHWRRRMQERWAQMTPEEREKFRDGMRARCGFRQARAEQPPAV